MKDEHIEFVIMATCPHCRLTARVERQLRNGDTVQVKCNRCPERFALKMEDGLIYPLVMEL
jgi:hypothetical protein